MSAPQATDALRNHFEPVGNRNSEAVVDEVEGIEVGIAKVIARPLMTGAVVAQDGGGKDKGQESSREMTHSTRPSHNAAGPPTISVFPRPATAL